MAYRGARKIISQRGSGGGVLTLHIVDGEADIPAASGGSVGDKAFCIAGGDDGKTFEVQRDSGGLAWVETTAGQATFVPPDDNATDLGDSTHAFQTLYLKTGIVADAALGIDLPQFSAASQLTIGNSVPGNVCNLAVDGTLIWQNGGAGASLFAFGGVPTDARVITIPDTSDTMALVGEAQSLSAKTLVRGALSVLSVADIGALGSPTEGELAYASDGRKPGEGGGAGTGVVAFYDGAGWRSMCDGAALAA